MSIKISQREYFTDKIPDALPLAVLQDINESYSLKYKLPKQEKKMRKAMRFAKTVYRKSTHTKFVKTSELLTYEKLHVDEIATLQPLSEQLEYLFLMTDFTHEMVEKVTCVQVLANWCYSLKLPVSSSISFMKGALNEKIKELKIAADAAALLEFENTKLQKEEQERIYREIREMERKAREAEIIAEKQRKAKRRQAAVELLQLDLILIRRVKKISIDVPYVEGKTNLGRVFLSSWKHQHLMDEACGGVYGLPERPELEIVEFEFRVFLPSPSDLDRMVTLRFLFDRVKLIFIITKKIEDRLLLYVHQGGRGNLWQHDIKLLKSAICRVGEKEFSTLDVFLQKSWRRFLIRYIAPLRMEPDRVAYIRELREKIVYDGDVAMLKENVTPEQSDGNSSSSEDSDARRRRRRKERKKKRKEEERKGKKKKRKKKKDKDFEEEGGENTDGDGRFGGSGDSEDDRDEEKDNNIVKDERERPMDEENNDVEQDESSMHTIETRTDTVAT